MLSEQFSEPPSPPPELEAQIPTVRAEGSHIMPGKKPAAEVQGPGASLRSFLLLGRSLFLGVAEGGQVVIKGESEIDTTGLIFDSNKTRSTRVGAYQCSGGTNGWEGRGTG